MIDFNSVLNDARQLSEAERLRLIDALWELVPAESNLPLHEAWAPELERRVAAFEAGAAKTVPWETIRAEALVRIGHGDSR
jgi:putative addiction module component (TIGR02574 family)